MLHHFSKIYFISLSLMACTLHTYVHRCVHNITQQNVRIPSRVLVKLFPVVNVEQIIANTHHIDFFSTSAPLIVCLSMKFLCTKVPYVYRMNFLWFTDIKPDVLDMAWRRKGNCEEKWFLTNWISKDFQIKQDKWKSHFASLQT